MTAEAKPRSGKSHSPVGASDITKGRYMPLIVLLAIVVITGFLWGPWVAVLLVLIIWLIGQ